MSVERTKAPGVLMSLVLVAGSVLVFSAPGVMYGMSDVALLGSFVGAFVGVSLITILRIVAA